MQTNLLMYVLYIFSTTPGAGVPGCGQRYPGHPGRLLPLHQQEDVLSEHRGISMYRPTP